MAAPAFPRRQDVPTIWCTVFATLNKSLLNTLSTSKCYFHEAMMSFHSSQGDLELDWIHFKGGNNPAEYMQIPSTGLLHKMAKDKWWT